MVSIVYLGEVYSLWWKRIAQTNESQLQKINVDNSPQPNYCHIMLKDLVTLNNSEVVETQLVVMGVYKLGKEGKVNFVR